MRARKKEARGGMRRRNCREWKNTLPQSSFGCTFSFKKRCGLSINPIKKYILPPALTGRGGIDTIRVTQKMGGKKRVWNTP